MTINLNTAARGRREFPWLRVAQFLLLISFVVTIYLLGLGMVHHRFFQGGHIDGFGHVRQ